MSRRIYRTARLAFLLPDNTAPKRISAIWCEKGHIRPQVRDQWIVVVS